MPIIGFLFGLVAFAVVVLGLFFLAMPVGGGFGTVVFALVALAVIGRFSKK